MSRYLIERYVIKSVTPYIGLAVLLLTGVVLAQQTNHRFADLLGAARAPWQMTLEILAGLLPSILVFTLPMAILAGIITGLSRMGSDSEIVAMRAAGVGIWRIVWPLLLIGLTASAATLYLGLEAAPRAARDLRRIAFQAALQRLESPVEPGTFYTDIPGKVIYVHEGDETNGSWRRIFIYARPEGDESREAVRIVTARSGRIDSRNVVPREMGGRWQQNPEGREAEAEAQAEMVLSDAVVTTLHLTSGDGDAGAEDSGQIVTERVSELRMKFEAPSQRLLELIRGREPEPEELDTQQLIERAEEAPDSRGKLLANIALQKKIALGVSPVIFALLGAGLGIRIKRGGRGFGILLSIPLMITYYLLSLGGEQITRTGIVSPSVGIWLTTGVGIAFSLFLLFIAERRIFSWRLYRQRKNVVSATEVHHHHKKENIRGERKQRARVAITGLMDRKLTLSLVGNFVVAWTGLLFVFLLFTLFELARYFTSSQASFRVFARYLFYLSPSVGLALAPVSFLVAVLATYAIMARRREAVAWWACGQSSYRLAFPAIYVAALISLGIWSAQESIVPETSLRQDNLREQIRGRPAQTTIPQSRQQWLAAPPEDGGGGRRRIYSYEFERGSENEMDNLEVFDFDQEGIHLRRIISGEALIDNETGQLEITHGRDYDLIAPRTSMRPTRVASITEFSISGQSAGVFKPLLIKPSHLNSAALSSYIKLLKRRGEDQRALLFAVAIENRRAAILGPPLMALIGLPLALAFGRRNTVAALSLAILIGLIFFAITGAAGQLGNYGLLPPSVAAWAPPTVFLAFGIFLLSRIRT
jgi:lipopolysaccharide export LptBFGC system permease protein LptF